MEPEAWAKARESLAKVQGNTAFSMAQPSSAESMFYGNYMWSPAYK